VHRGSVFGRVVHLHATTPALAIFRHRRGVANRVERTENLPRGPLRRGREEHCERLFIIIIIIILYTRI